MCNHDSTRVGKGADYGPRHKGLCQVASRLCQVASRLCQVVFGFAYRHPFQERRSTDPQYRRRGRPKPTPSGGRWILLPTTVGQELKSNCLDFSFPSTRQWFVNRLCGLGTISRNPDSHLPPLGSLMRLSVGLVALILLHSCCALPPALTVGHFGQSALPPSRQNDQDITPIKIAQII